MAWVLPAARMNDPSKLARFSSHGMAPVLVPLRPSSEHILIVRALRVRRAPGRSLFTLPLTFLLAGPGTTPPIPRAAPAGLEPMPSALP